MGFIVAYNLSEKFNINELISYIINVRFFVYRIPARGGGTWHPQGVGEPGTRKGCHYMSSSHIKLDSLAGDGCSCDVLCGGVGVYVNDVLCCCGYGVQGAAQEGGL